MSKFNYFRVLSIDGYDFPTLPQVDFGFNSRSFVLLNRSDYKIEYSFDGTTLHGDLDPTDASAGMSFDDRVECKIFFRSVDGYGTVRVEAWGA